MGPVKMQKKGKWKKYFKFNKHSHASIHALHIVTTTQVNVGKSAHT